MIETQADTAKTKLPLFGPGDVVQLRSGGPLLTVQLTDAWGSCKFVYFNTVTGLFEHSMVDQRCLRGDHGRPESPPIVRGPNGYTSSLA